MATPRNKRPLERPWTRRKLIRQLAQNEASQAELARRNGVSPPSMTAFVQRHRDEIQAVRDELDNEFAGMWIAQKQARLDAYARDAERAEELLEVDEPDPAWSRVKQSALKSAAEEMGQIPSKVNITVEPVTVRYEVVGVDPEALT